jgi:hypothetical protein
MSGSEVFLRRVMWGFVLMGCLWDLYLLVQVKEKALHCVGREARCSSGCICGT